MVPFGASHLGLGHRRLSIIDLSLLGHQPMLHQRSGCRLVFNGEIFNYRRLRAVLENEGEEFQGHSDSEVLLAGLARHGAGFVDRIEGMYAFAFLDARESSLLLARDPAGIKPLYFAETTEAFIFASEARAVLATGLIRRRVDRRGLAGYLGYGAVQHPLTLFDGVSSLPAGSTLTVEAGAKGSRAKVDRPRSFWRLPAPVADVSRNDAIADVRATLDTAVHDHLIADVPIGCFLSSGLDSTILAGLAAKHSRDVKCFTVTFNEEPEFDEGRLAAATAAHFGLDHVKLPVGMAEAEAAVRDWLGALDQPSIDGLNVFIISRAARARGLKVALSGLGGDELFGGYPSFRDVPRLMRWMRVIGPLPRRVRRGLAGIATIGRSQAVRAKLSDMFESDGSAHALYLHRRRALSNGQLRQLGFVADDLGLEPGFLPPDASPDVDRNPPDVVRSMSQLEFRLYQSNMLLRDADTNSMAAGLEIRVPMLDRRLLELVHSLPGSVRLPRGAPGKYLLRAAFPDLLRPELVRQTKRGFALPISRWMVGSLRPICENAIAALVQSDLLKPDAVKSVWQQFLAEPNSPMWTRAFLLVVLGDFVRRGELA